MYFPLIFAFVLTVILGFFTIKFLKAKQFGQSIREEGPELHKKKSGTPTIGGVIFLIPILITSIIFMKHSFELYFILIMSFGFGFIGFIDDYLKVYKKINLGLTPKQKLVAQLMVSLISYLPLFHHGFDTNLYFFSKEIFIDLKWFYPLFFIFLSIGTPNATNLTDGLDGLLTSLMIISVATYSSISFILGNNTIFTFSFISIVCLFGFFLFNRYPAKVFMGDTGSLALGGMLTSFAILTKTELLLAVIGGVFVFETLSVIIQVYVFKTKKKRVFKMTPIHHHSELSGWSERKVVFTFSIVSVILSFIALQLI